MAYYKSEFEKAGIAKYISAYSPEGHDKENSKHHKLNKYCIQFNVSDKNNVSFFDDALQNVNDAKDVGFTNSFQVTVHDPLSKQLGQIFQGSNKNIEPEKKAYPGTFHSSATFTSAKTRPLIQQPGNDSNCMSKCTLL